MERPLLGATVPLPGLDPYLPSLAAGALVTRARPHVVGRSFAGPVGSRQLLYERLLLRPIGGLAVDLDLSRRSRGWGDRIEEFPCMRRGR